MLINDFELNSQQDIVFLTVRCRHSITSYILSPSKHRLDYDNISDFSPSLIQFQGDVLHISRILI